MTSRNKSISNRVIFVAASFALVAALVAASEATNLTHLFHKQNVSPISTPTTGGASPNNQKGQTQTAANNNASQPTNPSDSKATPTNSNTEQLAPPSGDFVSNHSPGQGGSPTSETSVCNTTPGASCKISFTKDGTTYSLPTQTTDLGGSTYWNNWTPESLNLTVGSWQVTAIATLGNQTKTATDPLKLVISK